MKKAIMFDLDGTLVDSLPDISGAMNRSLEKHGLPTHPRQDYKYMVGNGVIKLAQRAVGDRQDMLDPVLKSYMEDYAENCTRDTCAYPGVPQMLQSLLDAGVKVCVLSNKDQGDVERVLRYVFPGFPFTICRGRVENVPLKPDPAGAQMILKMLDISPDDCWYVGDTGTDMQCGSRAGMETIGVLWGFRPREELVENGAKRLTATADDITSLVLHT